MTDQPVPVLNGSLMFLQGVASSYDGNLNMLSALGGIIKNLTDALQTATSDAYAETGVNGSTTNGYITVDNNNIQTTNNSIASTSSSNTGQLTKLGDNLNAQQQQLSVDTSKYQNLSQQLNTELNGYNQAFTSATASNQTDIGTGGQTYSQVVSATMAGIQEIS